MKFRIIKPKQKDLEEESLKWRFHSGGEKECIICKSKFNYGFKKTNRCGLCKIILNCSYCGKEFELKPVNSGKEYYLYLETIDKLINNIDFKMPCPDCKEENNPGICTKCKKEVLKRDQCNRGYECGCHN